MRLSTAKSHRTFAWADSRTETIGPPSAGIGNEGGGDEGFGHRSFPMYTHTHPSRSSAGNVRTQAEADDGCGAVPRDGTSTHSPEEVKRHP